jgi:hypothetical protein
MALGTTFINKTTSVPLFIPELWSDEILDALEHKLVMAKIVNQDFSAMILDKGGVIHIPEISNLSANAKTTRVAVIVQAPSNESVSNITINQHWEVSFMVEDLAEIQTSVNLRNIYTKRAGYAIANQVDGALVANAEAQFDTIDATSALNTSFLDEADILLAKTILDENDCPQEDRHLIVAPQAYNKLLAIDRFTSAEHLGPSFQNEIRQGALGVLHGFIVWMTQMLAATGTATTSTVESILMHRDALALAMQLAPRVQANYLPEYLGWLVTTDVVYGIGNLRPEWGIVIQNDAISYTNI